MSLRRTNPDNELEWCTVEMERNGDTYVEFHESERQAKQFAEDKIKDAKDSGESISIYVMKARWQS